MDCIFCRIVSGEIPSRIILTSKHAVAILDAFPLAAGHTLVILKRHCSRIQDMNADENADLFATVQEVTSRVDSAMTGASLVAIHNGREAGQEIPHLHVHIVPRNKRDGAGAIHAMFERGANSASKMSDSDADDICARIRGS